MVDDDISLCAGLLVQIGVSSDGIYIRVRFTIPGAGTEVERYVDLTPLQAELLCTRLANVLDDFGYRKGEQGDDRGLYRR